MQSARELNSHAREQAQKKDPALETANESESRADAVASVSCPPAATNDSAPGTLSGPGPRTVFSAPPFAMPFSTGDLLAGKYEVVSLLGVGGISFVVAALHRGFENYVALKFLRPEFALHPEAARRFISEAKSNFKLRSEHIVRVLDVDRLPNGAPFMVMERLAGVDLRSFLEDRGPLGSGVAVDFALQICEALAIAHAARVVHRDIKPENLFVTRQGDQPEQIKLLDFGICREVLTLDAPGQRIVTTEAVGSPPYMSPEQVRGAPDIDARSDIWSLGCVLHEMLTGRAIFQRASAPEAFSAVLEAPAPPLRASRPELPAELDAVIARCLAKLPQDRYQNVAELADALVPFAPAHAYVHAARCAQVLDEVAERRSGIQTIHRPSPMSRAPNRENARASGWFARHKGTLVPLGLVLSVPVVSLLALRMIASDPASARVQGPSRILAAPQPDQSANARAPARQQDLGPIEVVPLQPSEPVKTAGSARQAQTQPAAPRQAVQVPARAARPAPDGVRPSLPPEIRPLLPKPDPYAEPADAPETEPDVGF
jgi:eukaryotic-like serine/threonine-protein kinase